jgi:16S rRNA (cytosine967-C5)-methyltransferase
VIASPSQLTDTVSGMPRRAALSALVRSERAARPSSDLLDEIADSRKLVVRDRDLARELVQGVWRTRGSLDLLIAARSRKPLDKLDLPVLYALRLGAYQFAYLDRVPVPAALNETVEAVKGTRSKFAAGFVNAVLRGVAGLVAGRGPEPGEPRGTLARSDGTFVHLTEPLLPDPTEDEAGYLAAHWSHPRWLVERWLELHGPVATRMTLLAGLSRPILSLRPAEAHAEALEKALAEKGVGFEREGRCLLVPKAGRIEELPGWNEGWFAVQGPTAAEVVPALAAAAGWGVLELCAAPGGKTVALAERVGADGVVLAVDSSAERLARLRAEVARRGLSNVAAVEADAIDPANLPEGLKGRPAPGFDAVLLDVPCSNTGVLGRRVEARWRLEGPDRIVMLAEQAAHLMLVAAQRVRHGGRLAYSTCSIDRTENEDVVSAFLAEDREFRLLHEETRLPDRGRRDGGYHAILARRP